MYIDPMADLSVKCQYITEHARRNQIQMQYPVKYLTLTIPPNYFTSLPPPSDMEQDHYWNVCQCQNNLVDEGQLDVLSHERHYGVQTSRKSHIR
jgi:hypothetical protein